MLNQLPIELLCSVLSWLEYDDLDTLLQFDSIAPIVRHHLHRHFRFHYQTTSLLRLFESLTTTERNKQETRSEMATHLLQLICHIVEKCPKYDHRTKFTELLDTLQQLVVRRILSTDMRTGLEYDYASLCLQVRHTYLHTPSIRVLHDPKYRRRSTKHPLAPFLPRDYTWIWRSHCAGAVDLLKKNTLTQVLEDRQVIQMRDRRLRFARFFGSLFEVTSLYLESNLDGTFEECVREALVVGDVEDLLAMCVAAGRPVDVDEMCMMVMQAGEQLWSYLDMMHDWVTTNPTPQQEARLHGWETDDNVNPNEQSLSQQEQQQSLLFSAECMLPDRYKVQAQSKLRLKVNT
ncbi:hypothetical protein EC973_002541 [Apophysomyces ossiformis]|uniref:F-box domain-containing protein n=1 Tax=Apophysomyces ossiformis TaxID=679940 RepID=A0A8H7BYC0_9FUNG|nr:hypothetical protein EC973_002541 [Apophysomyces ossiformis]